LTTWALYPELKDTIGIARVQDHDGDLAVGMDERRAEQVVVVGRARDPLGAGLDKAGKVPEKVKGRVASRRY
jgi:hypothetical protein